MVLLDESLTNNELKEIANDIYDDLRQEGYGVKSIILSCAADEWDYEVILNGWGSKDIHPGVLNGKYSPISLSDDDVKTLNLEIVKIALTEY